MALPAGVISISTPMPSSGSPGALRLGLGGALDALLVGRGARLGVGAAQDRARTGVLAHEPQAPAAAGEQVLDDLLEVARRGGEGLLEGLADAAVGVADEALELAQRGLEVLALGLELLDVREGLGVLVLRERVDGAELLAARQQATQPRLQACALLRVECFDGGLGGEPELRGQRAERRPRLLGAVARLLRADLAAGDRLGALRQAPVGRALRGGALAQLAGQALAGLAVGVELGLEGLQTIRHRAAGRLQRVGEARGERVQRRIAGEPVVLELQTLLAVAALALGALGEPALGRQGGAELGAAGGCGPSSGPLRRCSISQPAWRSASAASSRARAAARSARSASSRAASAAATAAEARSTSASAACSARAAPSAAATSSSRRLRSASTRSSPPPGSWRSSQVRGDHTRPERVTAMPSKSGASPESSSTTHTSASIRRASRAAARRPRRARGPAAARPAPGARAP